eukprot:3937064-Rhodomonas_salina.1
MGSEREFWRVMRGGVAGAVAGDEDQHGGEHGGGACDDEVQPDLHPGACSESPQAKSRGNTRVAQSCAETCVLCLSAHPGRASATEGQATAH